jgi:N-acetylmuramoyl-L-alanine amidase
VVIDAGHGGEDGGAVGTNGIYEKDLNLQIAWILNDLLRANGIETVMTRSEDILLYDRNSNYQGQKKVQDLAIRRKIAETYENAVFVSIHMNAFPQHQYHGLQVYYSPNSSESKDLAIHIQSLTKELLMPKNNRSVKTSGGNIYLLDRLQCPAVLVECGFLSNPEECAKLSSEEYKQQMALSLCLSILEYFSDASVNSASAS